MVSSAGLSHVVPEPQVCVVSMGAEHLRGAIRLHQAVFPNDTIVRLGPGAVEALYRTYLDSARGIAFVAVHEGDVVGVAAGAIGRAFVRQVVRAYPWRLAAAAFASVVHSPGFVKELTAIARRPHEPWAGDPGRRFYFRTQVIAPEWRGRGIILPMVRALLSEARRRGAQDATSTVFDGNTPAMWVHRVLGFESRTLLSGPRHYRLDLERWDVGGLR